MQWYASWLSKRTLVCPQPASLRFYQPSRFSSLGHSSLEPSQHTSRLSWCRLSSAPRDDKRGHEEQSVGIRFAACGRGLDRAAPDMEFVVISSPCGSVCESARQRGVLI